MKALELLLVEMVINGGSRPGRSYCSPCAPISYFYAPNFPRSCYFMALGIG